ncbi:unnamed protein product [Staurois parvus]|uniref:Uncharacterized protein n=1 Tax=Staurois parvus TaxID=386267 RepID=A0ABN9AS34_9NEOB|nr:unnamed protein product [Staurois parvus]
MNRDFTQRSCTAICVPLCPSERTQAMDVGETSTRIGSAPVWQFIYMGWMGSG